jgi:hypothetical protein
MATANFNVAPSNASDAAFRAWITAFFNALATVVTYVAQTGDLDPSTPAAPSATNQKRGFRCYRFNDGNQASHPMFMRVDVGSGSTTTFPSLWIQIGQGLDGSGNLTVPVTGTLLATQQIHTNKAGSSTAFDSFVSASDGRLTVCLWPLFHLVNENPIAFNIERTPDIAGVQLNDAIHFDYQGGSTKGQTTYKKDGRTTSISGSNYVIPFDMTFTTATEGLKIGCFGLLHYSGFKVYNAATGFLIYAKDDLDGDSTEAFNLTVYGTARSYRASGRGLGLTDASSNVNRKLLFRND